MLRYREGMRQLKPIMRIPRIGGKITKGITGRRNARDRAGSGMLEYEIPRANPNFWALIFSTARRDSGVTILPIQLSQTRPAVQGEGLQRILTNLRCTMLYIALI